MFARKSVGFQEVVWKEKPRLGDHSFGRGFFSEKGESEMTQCIGTDQAEISNSEIIPQIAENSDPLELEPLSVRFSVCKVTDYSRIDISQPFVFTGSTDKEKSLVCPTDIVPDHTTERDDGWRGFRISGQLAFSLIGILARITQVLAENKSGVFAVSTFDRDYVLTKEANFERAVSALRDAGCIIREAPSPFPSP